MNNWKKIQQEKTFWTDMFSDEFAKTEMPNSFNIIRSDYQKGQFRVKVPQLLSMQAVKLTRDSDTRLLILLKANLLVLLKAYTGDKKLSIGLPIYRQEKARLINTILPLICEFENEITFRQLLKQCSELFFKASEFQNYSMEGILHRLGLKANNKEGYPLFDVGILLENLQDPEYINNLGISLLFKFKRDENTMELDVEYNETCFDTHFLELIVNNYFHMLSQVIGNIDLVVQDITALSDRDKFLQLEWGAYHNECQQPRTSSNFIANRFEEIAFKFPNTIALVFEKQHVTYGCLNAQANQLARFLLESGAEKGEVIAIVFDRSVEMFLSILAVIKSGCAYLPIDPYQPVIRQKQMVADSASKLVLVRKGYSVSADVCCIEVKSERYQHLSDRNLDVERAENDPIYVLFTSGSTGRPKGIVAEQGGLMNTIGWFIDKFQFDAEQRILLFSEYNVDVAQEDIYGALLSGSTLFVPTRKSIVDMELLQQFTHRNEITILNTVPSFLKNVVARDRLSSLKVVISGGERLSEKLKDSLIRKGYQVYNAYGPAEATIDIMIQQCQLEARVGIGRPIDNVRCSIRDEVGHLVPIGVVGEICVAGTCLTRGYLNKPELTAKKFVCIDGELVYRTGDYGCWGLDGNMYFSGRRDHQIKIRGHRIEIKEIEFVLLKMKHMKSVVTIVRSQDKDPRLFCYFTAKEQINKSKILAYLAEQLPSYMIPVFFKQLDQMPLMANGKIAQNVFDEPKYLVEDQVGVSNTPATENEEHLYKIWKKVLQTEDVGLHDNFFEVGGDSIKIVQLQHEVNHLFQIKATVLTLFKYPTISDFASYLQEELPVDKKVITSLRGQETVPSKGASVKDKLIARQRALLQQEK